MKKGNYTWTNYIYYRRHRDRRLVYFNQHHSQWKGMKKFARTLRIRLPEARSYIDQKLRAWYIQEGFLEELPPRPYKQRGKLWKSSEPAARPQPPLDKGDQSLD